MRSLTVLLCTIAWTVLTASAQPVYRSVFLSNGEASDINNNLQVSGTAYDAYGAAFVWNNLGGLQFNETPADFDSYTLAITNSDT